MDAANQLVVAILEETDGYVDLHPDQARRVIRKLGWLAELDRVTSERDTWNRKAVRLGERLRSAELEAVRTGEPARIARRVLDGEESPDGR